ncbi:hypothetical protein Golob_025020, partial [Gossypium lobatum]|nr:hypothetical protein [Gossypium lobatum]
MSKKVVGQSEPMETRGRARKASRLRGLLSALEDRVVTLKDSMRDVNERIDDVDDRLIDGLQTMNEQSRDFETIATTMALSTRIEDLEGELALCRTAVGKRVSSATLSNEDVSKPKEFMRTRSVCDVDNFLWKMENYFRAKGITNDAVKLYPEFVEEKAQAKLQWIIQQGTEMEQRGVQKLSEAMTVV